MACLKHSDIFVGGKHGWIQARCNRCELCKEHRLNVMTGRWALHMHFNPLEELAFVTGTYSDPPPLTLDWVMKDLEKLNRTQNQYARRNKHGFAGLYAAEYGGKYGRPHWHSMQTLNGLSYGKFPDGNQRWTKGLIEVAEPRKKLNAIYYLTDYVNKPDSEVMHTRVGLEYQHAHFVHLLVNERDGQFVPYHNFFTLPGPAEILGTKKKKYPFSDYAIARFRKLCELHGFIPEPIDTGNEPRLPMPLDHWRTGHQRLVEQLKKGLRK